MKKDHPNDRPPNFRSEETNELYLQRCFVCDPIRGRENWAPAVATGQCAWCGWLERSEAREVSSRD
jgi:hypothetical protein